MVNPPACSALDAGPLVSHCDADAPALDGDLHIAAVEGRVLLRALPHTLGDQSQQDVLTCRVEGVVGCVYWGLINGACAELVIVTGSEQQSHLEYPELRVSVPPNEHSHSSIGALLMEVECVAVLAHRQGYRYINVGSVCSSSECEVAAV